MQRIVTSSEMREIDRRSIEEVGIPGLILMENAGLGVVQVIETYFEEIIDASIMILCGRGNNGGDGMVVARHLFNRGFHVDVFLVGEKNKLKGDAKANLKILDGYGIDVIELQKIQTLKKVKNTDMIVDALLGTGVTGEVKGLIGDVIQWVNRSFQSVLSIDMPSGLHSDTGQFKGVCIQADHTVTMGEMKRGLVLSPGRELAGEVTIVDIGVPDFVAESVGVKTLMPRPGDIVSRLPERPAAAHKGRFGKVAILAGSTGLTGAAVMSSMASLRAGAGLTVLGIQEVFNQIY